MLGARCTIASRLAARSVSRSQRPTRRFFQNSTSRFEVKLFDMPSMSPTMEEGGIVEWKVRPGDAFSAGDVLLEIETDKAEIAVEAADDGVMGKILVEAGEKGIAVGKPIAILAEEGDDLASIDVDALVAAKPSKSSSAESSSKQALSEPKKSDSKTPNPSSTPIEPVPEPASHGNHGKSPLPVAQRLMHEHKLSASDIKGTGPHGRITKGDVLAHLGKISAQYVAEEQSRIYQRQKLDLSNIKPVERKPEAAVGLAKSSSEAAAPSKPAPQPIITRISIPLTPATAPLVSKSHREALRIALLSLKPRASILRDPVFDVLTAATKPPFSIKSAEVEIVRAKPVAYNVTIVEPPAPKSSAAVGVFVRELEQSLKVSEPAL